MNTDGIILSLHTASASWCFQVLATPLEIFLNANEEMSNCSIIQFGSVSSE